MSKYYWLKLKEDFFDDDAIAWLEEQENGDKYCLFYLKLCVKSLKMGGVLIRNVGDMLIPYDVNRLATLTNTDIDTVAVAMELLRRIKKIEILENGEIYISQVEDMTGSETKWAKYKRNARSLGERTSGEIGHCPKNVHTEIEIELEKERELEIERDGGSVRGEEREKKVQGDAPPEPPTPLPDEIKVVPVGKHPDEATQKRHQRPARGSESDVLPKHGVTTGSDKKVAETANKRAEYPAFERRVMTEWNKMCKKVPTLSQIRVMSSERRGKLKRRFEDKSFRENICEAIWEIPKSEFLKGENKQGWRVGIDWLIRNNTNYVKILEGAYKNDIATKEEDIMRRF